MEYTVIKKFTDTCRKFVFIWLSLSPFAPTSDSTCHHGDGILRLCVLTVTTVLLRHRNGCDYLVAWGLILLHLCRGWESLGLYVGRSSPQGMTAAAALRARRAWGRQGQAAHKMSAVVDSRISPLRRAEVVVWVACPSSYSFNHGTRNEWVWSGWYV